MATTTEVKFQEFTWQTVQKMADQIGVAFYTEKTQYNRYGFGIRATSSRGGFGDTTKIIIEQNEETRYIDNDHARRRVYKLAYENFMMKLELWSLKNNIQYVVTEDGSNSYIQIVKVGA